MESDSRTFPATIVLRTGRDDASATSRSWQVTEDVYKRLVRFARVVSTPSSDPEDLVHDAYYKATRRNAIARAEDPEAYLRTTIVRIASNERRRALYGRQLFERLRAGHNESSAAPETPWEPILASLSPEDRAVLFELHVEGRPSAEVAERRGISDAAVRNRASRARHAVRAQLEADTGAE